MPGRNEGQFVLDNTIQVCIMAEVGPRTVLFIPGEFLE